MLTVSVAGATDPSQSEYPTSIAVADGRDEIGSISCQGQQTCAGSLHWNTAGLKGPQVLVATIHTSTERSATSQHVTVGGAPPRRRLPVAGARCRLASPTVAVRRKDRGVCTIVGAPVGTAVAIQYRSGSGPWRTIVRGHVGRGGHYHFFVRGPARAAYLLAIVVNASRVSAAARVSFGTVHIG